MKKYLIHCIIMVIMIFKIMIQIIKLGTSNEQLAPGEEFLMKIRICKGRAIGCHEQINSLQKWCIGRNECYLNRPLRECGRCITLTRDISCIAAVHESALKTLHL